MGFFIGIIVGIVLGIGFSALAIWLWAEQL